MNNLNKEIHSCYMCDNAKINPELTEENDLAAFTVGNCAKGYRIMMTSGDGKPVSLLVEHWTGSHWSLIGEYRPLFCPNCGRRLAENEHISIAIDGPAAAGKTTLAKALAAKLGITYVDTGAMYRAFAFHMLNTTGKRIDKALINEALETIDFRVDTKDGVQVIYLSDTMLRDSVLRTPEVSNMASAASAFPEVRQFFLQRQRDMAKSADVVMEGRDIGTVVLPKATFKFFLTADLLTRAQRRYVDLRKTDPDVDPIDVANALKKRDFNDSNRDHAPLKPAGDSISLDSTFLSAEEVADRAILFIQTKLNMS